jgi:hypothetical protein
MVGTGEIKYPGWTQNSTAARQFDIDLSRARERKTGPKITWPSRLGVDAAGQLIAYKKKTRNAKKNQAPSLGNQIKNQIEKCLVFKNRGCHKFRSRCVCRIGPCNVGITAL